MSQNSSSNQEEIYSSATIKNHPIHPMMVVFPISTMVGVVVTDLVYLLTNDSFWAYASYWLVLAAVVTGIAASIFGLVDFLLNARIRRIRTAWFHLIGNLVLMAFVIVNFMIRNDDYVNTILPWGIVLSISSVIVLSFAAWFGGELVFHHKVGIDSRNAEKSEVQREEPVIAERVDLS
jgi:uncharacterized membrane protein